VFGWDLRRKLTSRVANYLATILLNPSCSDLTGSFRLYKRNVIEDIMQSIQGLGKSHTIVVCQAHVITCSHMDDKS
jgi:dolichol-phosphate mannosyltransferase